MPDLIRKERFLGGEKIIVGDKRTDLILESLGKVYIKSGNSSRLLNDVINTLDKLAKEESDYIIVSDIPIEKIEYPGDGKILYDKSKGILYLSTDNQYIELINKEGLNNYVSKLGDTMKGPLSIILENLDNPPLIVNSKKLVTNLNADYIRGETLSNYTKSNKDELITGYWKFSKAYVNNLKVDNISNFGGSGWEIDSTTNTLSIENIVVKNAIKVLEEVISRIGGGVNLWCSKSFKIANVKTLVTVESSRMEVTTNLGVRDIYFSDEAETPLISGYNPDGNEIEGDKLDLNSTTGDVYNFYDYFQGDFILVTVSDSIIMPKVNEIYRCQTTNKNDVHYYDIIVTNIDGDNIIARLSQTVNDVYIQDGEKKKNTLSENIYEEEEEVSHNKIGIPRVGDLITLIGNISSGQTGVYLSSLDYDSPCIKVIENSTTPDYEIQDTLNTKIGKLFNINDTNLNPEGVGIYTKNLYAKTGKWLVGNGEIKYSEDTGVSLNNNGKIEVKNNSISPFGSNAEEYIKTSLNSELEIRIQQLETLVKQLNTRIQDLETRVDTLERTKYKNI